MSADAAKSLQSTEPSPPVIVFIHDDPAPMAFASVEDAAGWMEFVDVKHGEYDSIFTVDDRIVSIAIGEKNFELHVTQERDEASLRRMLRDANERSGSAFSFPEDPTAFANAALLWQWEHRWPKRPRWLSRRIHGDGPVQV